MARLMRWCAVVLNGLLDGVGGAAGFSVRNAWTVACETVMRVDLALEEVGLPCIDVRALQICAVRMKRVVVRRNMLNAEGLCISFACV